tara:strand:- start:4100 stop:4339 length:240 start_codon:yes stop_codon:yes gene_type:complete
MRNIFEDLSTKLQGGDHEVEMAITDLKAIADMAAKLAIYFQDNNPQELEGWIQAKITKSADYMEAVYKNTIYSGDHFEE